MNTSTNRHHFLVSIVYNFHIFFEYNHNVFYWDSTMNQSKVEHNSLT